MSDTPNDPFMNYTIQCFRCGGSGCLECEFTGRRPKFFDDFKKLERENADLKAEYKNVIAAWKAEEEVWRQMNDNLRAKLAEAQRNLVPVAWSPVSKNGLLRGIRYGTPSLDDLQIAEADGDTIKYFCEMPAIAQKREG